MNLRELQREAAGLNLLVYKDPQVFNRYIIVDDQWVPDDLADEVARPGGMRMSPLFIGGTHGCESYLMGYSQCMISRTIIAEAKVKAVEAKCADLESTKGDGRVVALAIAGEFRRALDV